MSVGKSMSKEPIAQTTSISIGINNGLAVLKVNSRSVGPIGLTLAIDLLFKSSLVKVTVHRVRTACYVLALSRISREC
jgi:hypothetical protein